MIQNSLKIMKYTNSFLVFKYWKCPNNYTQLVNKSAFCFKIQSLPACAGKHLGFTWGPGDILVYETLYKASGMCKIVEWILMCRGLSLHCLSLHCTANCIFKESRDLDLPSSMKSEKMRTFTHRFYANFSMSHITSLLGCRQLEKKKFPARTKKLSKTGVSDKHIVCTFKCLA